MITVFYDGKCGFCSKEINYYRRIAPKGVFNWQDITETRKELDQNNISLSDGLRRLHVKDKAGKMHIGVDAFIIIWRQLKYWRALAFFVSLPLIRQISNFLYNHFANWRFKKLKHCQIAEKNDKKRY